MAALTNPALALGGVSIGVSLVAATVIARSTSPPSSLVALLALAIAAIFLSVRPETLFLLWFALAPFLQASADANAVGKPLVLGLYLAPPLVFAVWTVTGPSRVTPPRLVDALPAGFLFFVLVSLFVTSEPSFASIKAVYVTIGIGVVLYYFLAFGPIGSLNWEKTVTVLLVISIVESVMSIVDFLTGWNLWHDIRWQQGGPLRAVATLDLPAALGAYIGMGVVFALSVFVWQGPRRLRALAAATVVVGLPAIFFTYTRAPILALVLVGALVLAGRSQTRLLGCAVAVLGVVVIAASWSQITESRVYRERVTNTNNVEVRAVIQHLSLKLAEERPLVGWGHDSFDEVKNVANFDSGDLPQNVVRATTSHNTYLTILVQYGGIGLALLLVPWLAIGWRALSQARRQPELRWFVVGALASLMIYFITANANDFRFFSFMPAICWLLLGLLRREQLAHEE